MATRLESRVDEYGVLLVKIKGQGGAWGRPIVDDQGNFYRSLSLAAAAMNVSQSTMRSGLDNNEIVCGRIFAYATAEEVDRQVALSEEPKTKSVVMTKPTASQRTNSNPFTAVRWPDGTVTVRLTQGGGWTMTRSSLSELPEEVRGSCDWVS